MNRFTKLGVRAYGKADENLWVVALAAFYSPNYTEFGDAIKRHKSTVSRWAAAYIAYRQLKQVAPCNVRRLRKQLTIKHFYILAQLWKQYEFSPTQAIEYLDMAAEGWTAERMAVEIKGCEEGMSLFADWIRFVGTVRSWAEHLLNGFVPHDMPDEFRDRAVYLGTQLDELAKDIDEARKRVM